MPAARADRPGAQSVMNEVTGILSAIEQGDPGAAAQLLPLVYDELRKLAAQKLAREKPGQTLDATALVHEAYLRLVGDQQFDNRGHFFAAAAEAMRRILVETRACRGGGSSGAAAGSGSSCSTRPAPSPRTRTCSFRSTSCWSGSGRKTHTPRASPHLHLFGGLSVEEAGDVLGLSRPVAYRNWKYARAWLREALKKT